MTRIGSVVDGNYEVVSLIGEGGMSRVWLARDKRLNKFWAVKEFKRSEKDANNEIVRQSLIAEAGLMKKLDHPALPRIVSIVEEDETVYVVMDYVEGEALSKVLRRVGHAMPENDVIDWGIQLCDVLGYLHSCNPPVIYRDMKPGNIMLRDDGTVKLIDFGIAREYKENRSSDTQILGTRGYAAPEQFSHKAQTDARTDIYSLGVTLYHLVTGISPSEETELRPIREVNPQLSEGLEHIIIKATQASPSRRYQTCEEMAYDLENHERLTDGYRRVQKRKLRTFNALWIGGIVSLALGAGCLVAGQAIESSSYESLMKQGKYAEAIEVNPNSIEAYYALVKVEDGVSESSGTYLEDEGERFTVEESEEWEELFEDSGKNGAAISSDSGYARLCYDVGKLYFLHYYTDGDEDGTKLTTTGAIDAVEWFERAIDSKEADDDQTLTTSELNIARAYHLVGNFYKKIQSSEEDIASDTYSELWEAYADILDSVDGVDSDTPRLRLYQAVCDSIANYTEKFLAAGVSSDDIETVLKQVIQDTAELNPDTDYAQSLQDSILDGLTSKQVDAGEFEKANVWKSYERACSTYEKEQASNTSDDEEASE